MRNSWNVSNRCRFRRTWTSEILRSRWMILISTGGRSRARQIDLSMWRLSLRRHDSGKTGWARSVSPRLRRMPTGANVCLPCQTTISAVRLTRSAACVIPSSRTNHSSISSTRSSRPSSSSDGRRTDCVRSRRRSRSRRTHVALPRRLHPSQSGTALTSSRRM